MDPFNAVQSGGLVPQGGTFAKHSCGEKLAIGFFGIRGLGSFYYIAFALNAAEFDVPNMLWAVTGLIVLMSILVHGTSVTPVMQRLDRRRQGESATSDGARQPRMENAGTSPDH